MCRFSTYNAQCIYTTECVYISIRRIGLKKKTEKNLYTE